MVRSQAELTQIQPQSRPIWCALQFGLLLLWGAHLGLIKVTNFGFWDWISYGGVVFAAIMVAIETAINSSAGISAKVKPPSKRGWVGYLPIAAIVISAGAFAKQQFTPTDFFLSDKATTGSPFGIVQAWGIESNAFYMIIRPDMIPHKGPNQHVMLIVRPNYANVDKMTDTNILKSQSYTILNDFMTLALPLAGQLLHYDPTQVTPLEFDLVELPSMFSPEQVKSLSDLAKLGGRILASTGTVADFRHPAAPAAVASACPPPPSQVVPGKS